MISTVLLCAGKSRRMGKSKHLLPFKGKTVIDNVFFNLLHSKTENIVVVARENDTNLLKHIPSNKIISIIFNNTANADMFSSVVYGTKFLKDDNAPVMFFLGEHPLVDYKTINILIDAFTHNTKKIIMPIYDGIKGHPIIIDNSLKKEILSSKVFCLKDIMRIHKKEILEVKVNCKGTVMDLDTEQDYIKLLEES